MSLVKLLLRIIVAAALVALLLHKHEIPASAVLLRLTQFPLTFFLLALVLDLIGQTVSAYRWSRVSALSGNAIPFRKAWSIYFAGMFFNTCLPTTIGGDTVRVVGLSRQTGSKSVAFTSVFMDRNIGMAALLGLGLFACIVEPVTLQATLNFVSPDPIVMPLWPVFALLIPAFVLANMVLFSRRVYLRFDHWFFARLPGGIRTKIAKLHTALQGYRLPLPAFAWAFLLSLVYQFSEGALVWILALGLGMKLSIWVFCAMVMLQAVAGLLPITINNIGVRDGIFCAVLLGQTVALQQPGDMIKDEALALAWLYLAIVVVSGLVGGIVYMLAGVTRPTDRDVAELNNGLKPDEPVMASAGK